MKLNKKDKLSKEEFEKRKKINSISKAERKNDHVGQCMYVPHIDYISPGDAVLQSMAILMAVKGAKK